MAIICLTPEQESMFRRTHADFRCPMGHVQGFYGKSDQEKKIEKLENQVRAKEDLLQYYRGLTADLKAELRSRSARIGVQTRRLRRARSRA